MQAQLGYSASLAASGSATLTIPVPTMINDLQERLTVKYAAVAGTTGITAVITVSNDGSNYNAVPEKALSIVPPANAAVAVTGFLALNGNPTDDIGMKPTFLRVVLTNLDATNAAQVAFEYQFDIEAVG